MLRINPSWVDKSNLCSVSRWQGSMQGLSRNICKSWTFLRPTINIQRANMAKVSASRRSRDTDPQLESSKKVGLKTHSVHWFPLVYQKDVSVARIILTLWETISYGQLWTAVWNGDVVLTSRIHCKVHTEFQDVIRSLMDWDVLHARPRFLRMLSSSWMMNMERGTWWCWDNKKWKKCAFFLVPARMCLL